MLEDKRGLHRVQCKTARVGNGVLSFRTCSNTGNSPKPYRGEVGLFGICSPELNQASSSPSTSCRREPGTCG